MRAALQAARDKLMRFHGARFCKRCDARFDVDVNGVRID